MKVLAFAASNSSKSINRALVTHASSVIQSEVFPGAEVELLDINDYEMPLFSSDREERDGIPALAYAFRERVASADALVISFAEHNGSVTAAFKNLFDWVSRIDKAVYQGRPVVMLATSPGGRGGKGVLEFVTSVAPFFGADLRSSLSVPNFGSVFEGDELVDPDLAAALRDALLSLR